MIHQCPEETERWIASIGDYNNACGSIVDLPLRESNPVVKQPNDPAWMLDVNGGEYRGPIRYCPFCGESLDAK